MSTKTIVVCDTTLSIGDIVTMNPVGAIYFPSAIYDSTIEYLLKYRIIDINDEFIRIRRLNCSIRVDDDILTHAIFQDYIWRYR